MRSSYRNAGTRRLLGPTIAVAALLLALSACERSDPPASPTGEEKIKIDPLPVAERPWYEFAPGLRQEHPEVSGFVREFLETCLAGHYEDYRLLVSRAVNPESKERFEAIYHAIKSVMVETIDLIDAPEVPPPAYRVVTAVEFHPERKVTLRAGEHRTIAILVFKEDGQWRMAPAPAELQPDEQPLTTTSAPATDDTPDYPWDADGDY